MQKYVKQIVLTIFASLAIATPSYAQDDVNNDVIRVNDISENHPSKNEIKHVLELNLLETYPDFQFRPEAQATALEVEKALNKMFSMAKTSRNDQLSDRQYNEVVTYGELIRKIVQASNKFVDLSNIHKIVNTINKDVNDFITRAELAKILYELTGETNLQQVNAVQFKVSSPYNSEQAFFENLPADLEESIYIRAKEPITLVKSHKTDYGHALDTQYHYAIGKMSALLTVTVRQFNNGDYFLFTRLDNINGRPQKVDIIAREKNVSDNHLYRYDRYPIVTDDETVFGQDITSYPTGLIELNKKDGSTEEQMIGKSYRSNQLTLEYEDGGKSTTRSLLQEKESLSTVTVGDTLLIINSLQSLNREIVEHWVMNSNDLLFKSAKNRESWMEETAEYYIKRNNWYTAQGPLNKMATSTEPLPESGHGYGRNLLLVKEDRALVLYKEQGDRYFENLIHNSFVNLDIFKGDQNYWPTEVTSTYLKNLYNITAPFIDTRFNEQIALFYYNSGELFDVENYQEPLRNYADLLASQKAQGNIIKVDEASYYISDYFPIVQDVTTHSSMNHVLGGMNILLMAYEEFKDDKYLDSARAIMTAIEKEKHKWIRENGDIWYKMNTDGSLVGDDYQHLTLEDLINSYKLWSQIEPSHLPTIEEMIASKSSFLSNETLGYTTKIYNGLKEVNMSHYLPKGEERTDAK